MNRNEGIIGLNEMNIQDLLNMQYNQLQPLLDSMKSEVKQIEKYKYLNFYNEGISICLINEIVESIYLYNQNILKFNRYLFPFLV